MSRTLRSALFAVLLGASLAPFAASPAAASAAASTPPPASSDGAIFIDLRRPVSSPSALAAAELQARADLGRSLGQGVFDLDPRTGTVRVLARLDGFLTPPSDAPARKIVMRYVRLHRQALGLDRSDLATFVLVRTFTDLEGTRHLSWVQRAGGVEGFDNGLKASVTSRGQLVVLTGSPAHGLGGGATTDRPVLSASEALAAARIGRAPAAARRGDRARIVWFAGGRSILSWQTLTRVSGSRVDLSVVDGASGRILWRANMVKADTGTASAWESYPSTLVAAGGGTQAPVSFPVGGPAKLAGNNAHVYLDTFDDDRADPGDEIAALSGMDWSVPAVLNTTLSTQHCKPSHACTWNRRVVRSWKPNRRQSAAQTYYYLNRFHDHLLAAPIGFTEAAGNFQMHNPSGEGSGGDAVQAQVFDGAAIKHGLPDARHVNNANMYTRPDGRAPIMQTYLFREDRYAGGWPSANAGDDASVVYHEYTHGLSSRLVTYPNGWQALNAAQSAAMGEAWSDWYALDFLVDEGFETDTTASGEVMEGDYITGLHGVRFQAIDCRVGASSSVCPAAIGGGAGGFTYGDYARVAGFSEPHSDGEIWAQTLWDLRRSLGVHLARGLITRAMMLSPPEPSFLDMRNAIVQADRVAHHGVNADAIWKVFAHRGMGFFAASLDADDTNPVPNFRVAPDCASDPCATIKGVARGFDGSPLAGAVVGLAGHTSGFPGARMTDVTGSQGRFSVANVPFGTYPGWFLDRKGYDLLRSKIRVNEATETRVLRPRRDWAAADGGARIISFSGPNYGGIGCGPRNAIDRSLVRGWGSDLPGPRAIVVELPRRIDVTSFGVDPGATCGDDATAGTAAFDIYTRKRGGTWVLAARRTDALTGGTLHRIVPSAGRTDVRFVKFVMRSNIDARNPYLDMSELSVRGTPA